MKNAAKLLENAIANSPEIKAILDELAADMRSKRDYADERQGCEPAEVKELDAEELYEILDSKEFSFGNALLKYTKAS